MIVFLPRNAFLSACLSGGVHAEPSLEPPRGGVLKGIHTMKSDGVAPFVLGFLETLPHMALIIAGH
jgi:hypothetical protein